MSLITDNVYLGDVTVAKNIDWLLKHNITHIINTTLEVPNFFPNRFRYLKLNLKDTLSEPLIPKIKTAFSFIDRALGIGARVLIHCFAGISRSSSTTIYYVMRSQNMPFEKALDYVREKHPKTLPNKSFMKQLELVK